MMKWTLSAVGLAAVSLLGIACVGTTEDPGPAAADPEPVGATAEAVAAGCFPPTTCSGTKTCGAWSDYAACSGPVCDEFVDCYEGICGRGSCAASGTAIPENRSRVCTMHATGQQCVEYGYVEALSSCGC